MAAKHQAPKGTFDVLPADAAARAAVSTAARERLRAAGYGRIETPIFEDTGLFERPRSLTDNVTPSGTSSLVAGRMVRRASVMRKASVPMFLSSPRRRGSLLFFGRIRIGERFPPARE